MSQSLIRAIAAPASAPITSGAGPFPAWSFNFTRNSPAAAGLTFARASSAGYYNAQGAWVTALTDTLRVNHHPQSGLPLGFLSEEARTNFLLNSASPATQSVALSTGTHVLWVAGSGSCTCAAGTATGTGFGTATAGTPVVFSVTTAGSVVFTVSGSLTRFQCERGSTASSFIATTGASATRSADVAHIATAPISSQQGSLVLTGTITGLDTVNAHISINNGAGGTATRMHAYMRTGVRGVFIVVSNATVADFRQTTTVAPDTLCKMAFTYGPQGSQLVINGSWVAGSSTPASAVSPASLRLGHNSTGALTGQPNSHLQQVTYYTQVLSLQQLQQLTA